MWTRKILLFQFNVQDNYVVHDHFSAYGASLILLRLSYCNYSIGSRKITRQNIDLFGVERCQRWCGWRCQNSQFPIPGGGYSIFRLYLGRFRWVINLIYSTLFTYIPLPKFNQWDNLAPLISRKGGRRQVDVKRDCFTWTYMVSMALLYYCKKTNLFRRWCGWNNHGRGK